MKKKKKRDFDDIFDDPVLDDLFGDMIKKQLEIIKAMSEAMFSGLAKMGSIDDDIEEFIRNPKAKVYGVSIKIGPDGKPIIKEFGNIKPTIEAAEKGEKELIGAMEPLTEVVELDKEIRIIAEVPGVKEDDIQIEKINDREIEIKVEGNGKAKYYKRIKLNKAVNFNKKRVSYKNGILELIIPIK